jgi:4-oxalocrotonate tautomerase
MPIVEYRLTVGSHSDREVADLLQRSCELFAEVLECPIDRVRAVVHEVWPHAMCVGGRMVGETQPPAPFFTFFLLQGRPKSQRHRLLSGFTNLLVDCLGVDRSLIRGAVTLVAPDDWAIAGVPASVTRRDEVKARAAQQALTEGTR